MKKLSCLICILLCTALLCGCFAPAVPTQPTEETTIPTTEPVETAAPTQPEETTEETTEQEETTEETTAPAPVHSELYIPGLDVEDVIRYFNEVCLDAEFVNGGNATLLQKWDTPIYCGLNGTCTEEDYATLISLFDWLNTVEGFPGIGVSQDPYLTNLNIHFCSQQGMVDILGQNFMDMDGGVTFWYDGENRIYNEIICYRTDLDQYLRNSVILEEIYNGLGPVQDTTLRPDSIIYAEFSQPQALTDIDELILKLLYHPDMKCGMNAAECEAVIRQLYF